jgi:glycosyltransferase involved in cell wall biosynthesis
MSVKVSVVVPVYNPGPAMEPCIASLLGQSLPADRVEILFVDDGSDDGTAARLDEVAAEASNVRVIHIPPSGAPGRPRNVGIAEARGEYIHFVDADDILTPRALQWLTEVADRNGSDVVMGKYASASLDRSQVVFTHSRARASLAKTPELLTASWAPAKLFRTSMLREHDIRFEEGWRWLEDQLFVLRSYLAARNVSIFADAPCYYFVRREEGGHLSAETLAPEPHAEHLARVFDVIEELVPEGTLRLQLLRRFYRANMLSRLDERYLAFDDDLRGRTFAAFHQFVTNRVDPSVDASFGGATLARARFLRAGDAAGLLAFTRRLEAFDVHAAVTNLRWRDGWLVVDVRAGIRHSTTGEPLPYLVRDGRTWLDPELVGDGGDRIDAEISTTMGRVSLIDPETALEWLLPAPFAAVVTESGAHPAGGRRAHVTVVASVAIDPRRVGPAGIPLADASWQAILRWSGMGVGWTAPLRFEDGTVPRTVLPAAFDDPLRLAVPRLRAGELWLDVGGSGLGAEDWVASATTVERTGDTMEAVLPIVAGHGAGTTIAQLSLDTPAGELSWRGVIHAGLGRMRVRAEGRPEGRAAGPAAGHRSAAASEGTLRARLGPPFDITVELGSAHLEGRALRVAGATDPSRGTRIRRWIAWHARSGIGRSRARLRQAAVNLAVRLPDPLRRLAVAAYRRVRGRST